MTVKIRLRREGRKKKPFYGIIVADSRSPRDGKFIERIGFYDPITYKNEKIIAIKIERVKYWISKGAIPSKIISKLLFEIKLLPENPQMKKTKIVNNDE